MVVMRMAVVAIVVLCANAATGLAQECGTPEPRGSSIWAAYEAYVRDNYLGRRVTDDVGGSEYAFGHALGRLASAVQGDPAKAEAFACVQLGLEQGYGSVVLSDVALEYKPRAIYQQAMQAAMGMHDALVATRFGVTDASPLQVVFDNAQRIAGRGFGSGVSAQPGDTPAPRVPPPTPEPNPRPADVFGVSSTAPTRGGADTSCTTGDRWSLLDASFYLTLASGTASNVGGDCTGDLWNLCNEMHGYLVQARDQIFQVFDQNHDGVASCRLCNYDEVLARAEELIEAERWLSERSFNASGLSTIYYTIRDRSADPLCRVSDVSPSPVPVPSPVIAGVDPVRSALLPDASAQWSSQSCSNYFEQYQQGTLYRGNVMVVGRRSEDGPWDCAVLRYGNNPEDMDAAERDALRNCRDQVSSNPDSCRTLVKVQ